MAAKNCDLLCILLATAGNTGEKLYFKYPYSPFLHKKKASKQGTSLTDKHIVDRFHIYDFVLCPWSIRLFALKEDQQELRSRSVSFTSNNFTPDSYIDCPLWSFSDSLLASILSPKEAMCNKNFELAIDDILFIGYPTIMKDAENPITASSASGSPASSFKGPATTNLLHITFVLQQHRYILLICKLEIRELNFELYENKLSEEDAERLSRQLPNLAYLTDSHKATIMKYVGTKQKEEIQFFIRLCKYFDGRHHIEDIMYWENLPRDEIFEILNRFNEITITFWLRDIVTIAT
ncbi:uncharacterized protein TRIADDRAFT_62680 [Trichoplax adhaerens]|uniref:GATOR complex protein NPRL3 n=1 Tax=Trichoplax adhaerens TaxID=10228 RepID=B3SEI9_TRIAD|nr:hypothetical protein TRIADDRAFT_62680 [Trichoplax adhaerens]EDV18856.1 hypothetical protein TRIADDRAFT_62680 [Trichoplax adhaerens]|eukprot:XP_002118657.1 hypothetical protein TRIADDRAFT_62680 [Trichoplax adhaerens]